MFDGVTPTVEPAAQANTAVGVTGDFLSPTVSLVHNRAQLFDGKRGLRCQLAILSDPRTVRHIHLDPVRTVVELLARRLARFHRPVDNLGAFGHFELGSIAFQHVPASARDCPGRRKQPWSRNIARVDRLLDTDVAVSRALGLHIAQGRKSLLECPPR